LNFDLNTLEQKILINKNRIHTSMTNLIIFGPPGSGKGTQSNNIVNKYGFRHIATGEIFRSEIKNQTELGLKVKSIIDDGKLVPDDLVLKIFESTLDRCINSKGIVFDGFPRTKFQAEELKKILNARNTQISVVVSLEVNEDELIRRLTNRKIEMDRTDDTTEIVKKRLKVYHDTTEPLIRYYTGRGIYKAIDGIGTVEEIFNRITNEIDKVI